MELNQARIASIADKVANSGKDISSEEASKTGLVMPMLSALGYDVFNPLEVTPEYTADIGRKKAEKVDFAIYKDGEVIILIECKRLGESLDDNKASQLRRYFNATPTARFGILTNGKDYLFFSDSDALNIMDDIPFFHFDVTNYDDADISELSKFVKESFDVEVILATASNLKYRTALEEKIKSELKEPSDALVKVLASGLVSGSWRQPVIDKFRPLIVKAWHHYLRDEINNRFKKALNEDEVQEDNIKEVVEIGKSEVSTTQEEVDGFNIIRAIVAGTINLDRVVMRDKMTYCGVLIDDNNRRPLARMHFNRQSVKYLGLFSSDDNSEEKVQINNLTDIFNYADKIKQAASKYCD